MIFLQKFHGYSRSPVHGKPILLALAGAFDTTLLGWRAPHLQNCLNQALDQGKVMRFFKSIALASRKSCEECPVWGAISSNVADVKTGLSLLSRQGLSQLSHKVLALDANLTLTGFLFVPLLEPLSTLARAASRVETLATKSTD